MKKIILLLITTFLFITGCVESDFNMHGEITVGNDTDDPDDEGPIGQLVCGILFGHALGAPYSDRLVM